MAYRESEYREQSRCIVCGELASDDTCRGCGRPLCAKHPADEETRRCPVCDRRQRRATRLVWLGWTGMVLFVAPVAVVWICLGNRFIERCLEPWRSVEDYLYGPLVWAGVLSPPLALVGGYLYRLANWARERVTRPR